ncbi:MAG: spore germination protein [Bacillota bacterium]
MYRFLWDMFLGKKPENSENSQQEEKLKKSLADNLTMFRSIFDKDETIRYREFSMHKFDDRKCCIIFTDGLANQESISENIVQPLMYSAMDKDTEESFMDFLMHKVIVFGNMKKEKDVVKLVEAVLYGESILLVDGLAEAVVMDTKGWNVRAIEEPLSEGAVRGPREGFNESILINLSLIKRKIKSPDLKFQFRDVGTRTRTKVCVCYIESLVNEKILKEVQKRLDDIKIDGILESGYIEEFIEDSPLSPYSTVGNTERPDIVAANLLEGRVAIVVDGTPFVLTVPYLFIEYFQANEDYYNGYIFSSINRMLRFLGFLLSTSVPAVYVALATYHQEMIPTPLLLSIYAAREGIPFPTIVEALLMLLAFEILREGGVRLPQPIGAVISFVGALILGEAAVNAKFVSAPIVIVTALTGISNFLLPKMLGPLIVTRTIFLILSAFLGLYGYIFGLIGLFIHLMSMRSFGIPYMLTIGDIKMQDIKDTAVRAPWWLMYYRPKLFNHKNPIRKKKSELPEKR